MTKEIATLHYRAPEVILDNLSYTQAVDMWAIGCVIYQCLTGLVPFEGNTEMGYLIEIFKRKGTPSEKSNIFFKNSPFLLKMIRLMPKFAGTGIGPDSTCRNDDDDKLVYGFG